jgi:hypothetical protein
MGLNPTAWPLLLKLFFLFGPFVVMFIGMGMIAHMAFRDLDGILKVFSQSCIISSYGDEWGGGSLATRCTVMFIIIGAVLWPKKHLHKGHLVAEELNSLPISIKRRMQISAGFLIFGFTWFAGFLVLMKLFR